MVSWVTRGSHAEFGKAPSTTNYIAFGGVTTITSEGNNQSPAPFTGTWELLATEVSLNSLSSASTIFKSRIAGSDGNQTFTVTFGQTGNFQDTTNTDSVTQADLMSMEFAVAAGGSGTIEVNGMGWKYE